MTTTARFVQLKNKKHTCVYFPLTFPPRSQRIRHKWIDDKKKKNLTKIFNLSLRYDDPLSLSTVIGRGNPTIVIPFYARWSNCDRGVERQQSSDVHQRATSRSRLTRDVPIPLDRRVSQLGQLGRRKWPRIQFVCADNETIIRINEISGLFEGKFSTGVEAILAVRGNRNGYKIRCVCGWGKREQLTVRVRNRVSDSWINNRARLPFAIHWNIAWILEKGTRLKGNKRFVFV